MATNSYLKYGDTGDSVLALQKQLNSWGATQTGYTPLKEDAIFGSKTNDALRRFQSSAGISVDGLYGNQTANAFANVKPAQTVATATPVQQVSPLQTTTQQAVQQPTAAQTPSAYNWTFNYNPEQDTAFQNAVQLNKSQIAQEMAARGMGGSTIEQERIAQAIAGLNLNYRQAAYEQFSADRQMALAKEEQEYNRQRQYKEDQLTRVETVLNGVFDNEAARAWGVPPGTRSTERIVRDAQYAQELYDRQVAAAKAQADAQAAAVKAQQESVGKSSLYASENGLLTTALKDAGSVNEAYVIIKDFLDRNEGKLSAAELELALSKAPAIEGKSAYSIALEILRTGGAGIGVETDKALATPKKTRYGTM